MNMIIQLPSTTFAFTFLMLLRVVLHSVLVTGDYNLDDEVLTSSF